MADFLGKAEDFDLLLTDMVMPGGLSGRELAEHLKSRNPALKVLFTSGYNGENLGQDTEFLRQTQSEFIPKPCSPHQLLKAVRKCLEHRWTTENDMRNSSR